MTDLGVLLVIGMGIWIVFTLLKKTSPPTPSTEEMLHNEYAQPSPTLEEWHSKIVQAHLNMVRARSSRRHYIEDSVRDCIQAIAEAQGQPSIGPNSAYLYKWQATAPHDYQILAISLLARFRAQQDEMIRQENAQKLDVLKTNYLGLINQFYDIAERKVSLRDDYGEENWDSLNKEIDIVIHKIAKKEACDVSQWKKYEFYIPQEYKDLRVFLNGSFREYHLTQTAAPRGQHTFAGMTGVAFEVYLMKLLHDCGFTDIRGTPTTGDQGADLLARKDGKNIVIQAKRYDRPVGNKAVQEVVSAMGFYAADEGWVVTNATFTKSAKELAQRTGVKLIDGFNLTQLMVAATAAAAAPAQPPPFPITQAPPPSSVQKEDQSPSPTVSREQHILARALGRLVFPGLTPPQTKSSCTYCGAAYNSGSTFCTTCGHKLP